LEGGMRRFTVLRASEPKTITIEKTGQGKLIIRCSHTFSFRLLQNAPSLFLGLDIKNLGNAGIHSILRVRSP